MPLVADPAWHRNVASFSLDCVALAGFYVATTAGKRVLPVQTVPALLALLAVWLA